MEGSVEARVRKPFTPGWATTLDTVSALPIKRGNKVIPVNHKSLKRKAENEEEVNEKIISAEDEVEEDDEKKVDHKAKAKLQWEQKAKQKSDIEVDLELKSPAQQLEMKQKIAEICMNITSNPEESILRKGGKGSDNPDFSSSHIKELIALSTSKDPVELELALLSTTLVFKDICPGYRIRSAAEGFQDEEGNSVQLKKETKRLQDFERGLLHHYQLFLQILERRASWGLSHLSKVSNSDASPAYRAVKQSLGLTALRCQCELLKTLVHFNFRSTLLTSVTTRGCSMSSAAAEQDDSIAQVQSDVTVICAEALEYIVRHDTTGEVSYEFVMLMNKLLKQTQLTLSPRVLQCLESIKVTVKADDAYLLKQKLRQEKKRRRKDVDKIESGLMEANLVSDDVGKKRFQVNSLQEMSLLYFRILKLKTSEANQRALLPMALAGLGRLTHLINIDHIVDLMTILRGILDQGPSATPTEVRLLCIYCALKTLAGPGEVLQIDDEPYLKHLQQLITDLPKHFDHWASLFDCLNVYFVERREDKMPVVERMALLLLILTTNHLDSVIGSVMMSMAHMLILRYPRVRQSFQLSHVGALLLSSPTGPADIISGKVRITDQTNGSSANKNGVEDDGRKYFEEDGRMEDLAMRGLLDTHTGKGRAQDKKRRKRRSQQCSSADPAIANSYLLMDDLEGLEMREQIVRLLAIILQRSGELQQQTRFRRIVNAMCHQDLVPLPLRRDDLEGTYAEILQRRDDGQAATAAGRTSVKRSAALAAVPAFKESAKVVEFADDDDEDDEEDDDQGDAARGDGGKRKGGGSGGRGGKNGYGKGGDRGGRDGNKKSFGGSKFGGSKGHGSKGKDGGFSKGGGGGGKGKAKFGGGKKGGKFRK